MRVIVTRPRAQARPLVGALEVLGAEVVECPLIEIEWLSDEPIDGAGYDWLIVTSPNGADEVVRRGVNLPPIAAVGPGTAEALREHGIEAAFVPDESSQDGLLREFPRPAGRVLFVGAEGTGELLQSELDADVRAVYRTRELVPDSPPSGELVLLASGSAVRAWAKVGLDLPAISIGPQTTAAAAAAGVEIVSEARTPDVQGLVDSAASWRDSSRS